MDLDRFVQAQALQYADAAAEIRAGQKITHWVWFVLPNILGLGHSEKAQYYAIAGQDEARAYYFHPVLGPRLTEISELTAAALARGIPLLQLYGDTDALKTISCLTLFVAVTEAMDATAAPWHEGFLQAAQAVLAAGAAQGYPRCARTVAQLRTVG